MAFVARKYGIVKEVNKSKLFFHPDGWTTNKARAKTYDSVPMAGQALTALHCPTAKLARVA